MMDIRMMSLEYSFDSQGNTEYVNALFNGTQGREYINARVSIKPEDLAEGQTLDDLNRKQLEELARKRLSDITAADAETPEQTE